MRKNRTVLRPGMAVIAALTLASCSPANGAESLPERRPVAATNHDTFLLRVGCREDYSPDVRRIIGSAAQFVCTRAVDGATHGMMGARVVDNVDGNSDPSVAFYELTVNSGIQPDFPPIVTNAISVSKVHVQGADITDISCVTGPACMNFAAGGHAGLFR